MFRKLQPSNGALVQHVPVTITGQLRQDGELKVLLQSIAGLHICDGHQGCVPRFYLANERLGSPGHFWGTIISA